MSITVWVYVCKVPSFYLLGGHTYGSSCLCITLPRLQAQNSLHWPTYGLTNLHRLMHRGWMRCAIFL